MYGKKNKKTGFNLAGNSGKYGFRVIPNESVQWRLQSADGTYFGDVHYDIYKAAESGTLGSSVPSCNFKVIPGCFLNSAIILSSSLFLGS